jgi:hypothetical protein
MCFVKVFDILLDALKNRNDYQKKWQNPEGLTLTKLCGKVLRAPRLSCFPFLFFEEYIVNPLLMGFVFQFSC